MSNDESTPAPESAAPPAARPVRKDRIIVRGLIGVLLVVLVIEAVAFGRVTSMHRTLTAELQKVEREGAIITKSRIDALVGRGPDATHVVKAPVGEERYDVYGFGGLLKRRELIVHYGVQGVQDEPEVLDVLMSVPDDVVTDQ